MNLSKPYKLVFIMLLLLLILCVSNLKKSKITNYIENYSNNYANLDGNWIIQSITPEKTKTIKLKQNDNKVKGNSDNCLGQGVGTISNNKIIWLWNNKEQTKMIGDIIFDDFLDTNKATKIKWQNGFVWQQILPSDNISGEWNGDGLQYGTIRIQQENNSISAIYPIYGGFNGTIFYNKIKIKWFNNVVVNGVINNNVITWDTGYKWNKNINKNVKKEIVFNDNIVIENRRKIEEIKNKPVFNIEPPPLELPKEKVEKKIVESSPLPPIIKEYGPYPVLVNTKESFSNKNSKLSYSNY